MNIDNTDVFYIDSSGDAVFTGKVTIGSNSEFEVGYNPITLSDDAKDSLAQSMGYDDYADMVAEATAGNTIIDGGYINAILIEAHSIVADMFAVGAVDVGARNLALGTEFGDWVLFGYADITHSDITVENLITDGNFDADTDWTDLSATVTVASNECEITASAQYGGVYQYYADFADTKGHVMFYGAYVYSASTSVSLILNDGVKIGEVAALTTGQYEYLCGLFTVDASASFLMSKIQDFRASGWTTVKVKYWTVVDLTAKYGAGKEPTLANFKAWLLAQPNGWFDTTAKVHGWIGARTNIVKATANASTTAQFGAQQATKFRTTKLVEGETYTLSFLVRGNVSAINYAFIRNTTADSPISMNEAVASATVFNRVSKTFVATADMGNSTASWLLIGYSGAFTTSSWFQIQEVKLEKGNVVTDWCPAATETSAFNSTTNMWYRIDNERAGYYNATTDAFAGGLAVVGDEVKMLVDTVGTISTENDYLKFLLLDDVHFLYSLYGYALFAENKKRISFIGHSFGSGTAYWSSILAHGNTSETAGTTFTIGAVTAQDGLGGDDGDAVIVLKSNSLYYSTEPEAKISVKTTASVEQALGADATGPYYIKSGVKTYF
jgi:hypothetical protein